TRVSILDHDPVPLLQHAADAPKQLERIVVKALAKDRAKRYQTITDLKLDLEQLRDEVHYSTEHTIGSSAESATRILKSTQVVNSPTHERERVETVAEDRGIASSVAPAQTTGQAVGRPKSLYLVLGVLVVAVAAALIYWKYFLPPTINSVAILP